MHAPPDLRDAELAAIATGTRRAGVWGADPGPAEGEPARVAGDALHGTKIFCSGAGGLQRAIVLARAERRGRRPLAAWVDLTAPRRSRSIAPGSAARGCARRPAIA